MNVGNTFSSSKRESSLDAYRDIGGRANHDYRDIEGRVTPGAVTEETEPNRDRERLRTNIGYIRVDSMDGIGRDESGTETEKMSGRL